MIPYGTVYVNSQPLHNGVWINGRWVVTLNGVVGRSYQVSVQAPRGVFETNRVEFRLAGDQLGTLHLRLQGRKLIPLNLNQNLEPYYI